MAYRRKMLEVQTELLVLKKMSNEEDFHNQQEELRRRQDMEVMALKHETSALQDDIKQLQLKIERKQKE